LAKARGNTSTTWIWLADAVELVAAAVQSSDVAKRIIREARAAAKIRCRGLKRGQKRDVDPGVNNPRFWRVPSSDVWLQIYWSESRARRRVMKLDRHRRARALCDYEVYAIEVVREHVIAALPAVAQAKLAGTTAPATATAETPAATIKAPAADRPGTSTPQRKTKAAPKKTKRQSPQTERAKRYIAKNFPDGTDGITTKAIHKKLTKDEELKDELKQLGTWDVPSPTAINRALGRRKT
jgi:hypothetical protein